MPEYAELSDDSASGRFYRQLIQEADEALTRMHTDGRWSPSAVRKLLADMAHHARHGGIREAQGDIYTDDQAAAMLGLSAVRVRQLADARSLGTRLGRRTLLFRMADIDAMRERAPRGPKPKPAPA